MISKAPPYLSAAAASFGHAAFQPAPSGPPQFFRPEVREAGTQTQPALLNEYQLPPNKRTWSRAFGQESGTVGVPVQLQNLRLLPVPSLTQATQVQGVEAVAVVVHAAMPDTAHRPPEVPSSIVTGPAPSPHRRDA